jgi:hypothetical protein
MTDPLFDALWLGLLALVVIVALDVRGRAQRK